MLVVYSIIILLTFRPLFHPLYNDIGDTLTNLSIKLSRERRL